MAKNKVWIEGEPCKKCGEPVIKHKEYPQDHMYTFCFMCTSCKTTYFNKRLGIVRRHRLERNEKKRASKKEYKQEIRNLYYTKPYSGIEDIVSRMRDLVERFEQGRIIRQVLIRIFEINFRKSKVRHPHGYSKEEVLVVMREMANHDLMKKRWLKKRTNAELRGEYEEKKLKESWRPHVDGYNCYVCDGKANVRHHLVPLKNGGSNSYRNIRVLCNPCHAEIHPWLKH